MSPSALVLRSRWVLPIDRAPIEDGAVALGGGRILDVGPAGDVLRRAGSGRVRDLGPAIILPGLVDAHTHLAWAGLEPVPLPFAEWIERMADRVRAAEKATLVRRAARGARRLLSGGVTSVGDSGPFPEVHGAVAESGLGGVWFLEAFGPDPGDVASVRERVETSLADLAPRAGDALSIGLAPHAPYTVSGALYRALAALARERGLPLTTHLAESREEAAFLSAGEGPLAERLRRRGIETPATGLGPGAWLDSLGVLDGGRWLLAHGVHLDRSDLEALGGDLRAVAVVLCPVSNEFLGVGTAPVRELYASGLEIALGTDGEVTDPEQDLFGAMRRVLEAGAPSASSVLRSATLGGARALGIADRTGSLAPGKRADVIAIACDPARDPFEEAVLHGERDRVLVTISGGRIRHDKNQEGPKRAWSRPSHDQGRAQPRR